MKIAITGGAGFIGSRLASAYLEAGHDVLVIDSLANGVQAPIDPRTRFYQVDIRDEKLRTILQMERPDLVSHHAVRHQEIPSEQALIDADVHIRGLLNVLESCVNASVRRIVFASGGPNLYGNMVREQLPLSESTPLAPCNTQDICKAAGEWYVRYYTQRYGLRHSILRYAEVYGDIYSRINPQLMTYFIHMITKRRRPIIRGSGLEIRDYIHIDDVARANLYLLRAGENCTLNISSGCGCTVNQVYMLTTQQLACRIEPIYLAGSPLDAPALVLDNTLARRVLGWQPEVEIEEGVRRLIEQLSPGRPMKPIRASEVERRSSYDDEGDDGLIRDNLRFRSEATLSRR